MDIKEVNMGTNYYYKEEENCPTCGHVYTAQKHIGKQSAGWNFLWHSHPYMRVFDDFETELQDKHILDEYGEFYTWGGFLGRITMHNKTLQSHVGQKEYYDADGYEFCAENFS